MESLHQILEAYCKIRDYDSIYEFIVENDKSGRAYTTGIKTQTNIPGRERLERWAKILRLSREGTARLLDAAERDRVAASVKRKTRMAPAMELLQEELAQARSDLASKNGQLVELKAILRDIVAKCPDIKLSHEQLVILGD